MGPAYKCIQFLTAVVTSRVQIHVCLTQ